MIIINGRGNDEWTSNAIMFCDIERLEHAFYDLNLLENKSILDELKEKNIALPAIYDNTQYIGGYAALQQWVIRKNEEEEQWQVV